MAALCRKATEATTSAAAVLLIAPHIVNLRGRGEREKGIQQQVENEKDRTSETERERERRLQRWKAERGF